MVSFGAHFDPLVPFGINNLSLRSAPGSSAASHVGSFNDLGARGVRLRHPLRNKKRLASLRAVRQMTSAAMRLIGDDKGRLSEKRMEQIGDDNFAAKILGIMTSRRTVAATIGR